MEVELAPDIQERVNKIIQTLNLDYINSLRIICMRSKKSTANAYARIWNLPQIWQKALDIRTYYVIEVLSENFDHLPEEQKTKVLIHELIHIPKTFSGALRPHAYFNYRIDERTVNEFYQKYLDSLSNPNDK
ncbi:MAG: putative metallopeptidase [Candidatus Micrarchaeota archaeon]|nr:putative metallopeptidase [Candidatus Micrarchaeota archaeon]